jgi:hypothetical protein
MPLSVAVNNQYDMFILEDLNKRVVKFDRFNQPSASFGSASENLGQLLGPQQVNIGVKNEIYISDPLSKSVMVFDFLGNYIRRIQHPDFQEPRGIDVSNIGELIVADRKEKMIFFFNEGGKLNEVLDLQKDNIDPTDVARHSPRGTDKSILYISSQTHCFQYQKIPVSPNNQ